MKKWVPFTIAAGITMGLSAYWFYSRPFTSAQLLECLPEESALHAYLDLGLLRSAGILDKLAGAAGTEEAEYKQFVQETGFDYRTDLIAVAGGFRNGDEYFAVRGKFHFDKLTQYAQAHGGQCQDQVCSMPASANKPGKFISYTPVRNDVLALAVAKDPRATDQIIPGVWKSTPKIPIAALWIDAPPFVFNDPDTLPTGTKPFLSPLASARDTTFTLGPTSDGKSFEIRMDVETMNADDATKMASQFIQFADVLKKMIGLDNLKPNSGSLAGVLMAGHFETQQAHVIGQWPIDQAFLDSLVSGKIQ